MRQIITALLVVILAVSSSSAAAAGENLTVGSYVLADRERIERSVYDYTFRADITNNNTYDIRNVTAKLKDNAVSADVPDGTLSFGDVPAGGTVTSTDTFTVRVNRRFEFEASSLTWETDFSSDVPPEITLTVPNFLELTEGESGGLGFTAEFRTYDTDDYTLAVSQTISPDSAGISLLAEFPSEWTGDDTGTWMLSQRITGNMPGMYEITTVITVPETGVSDQGTTAVSVVGKSDDILGSLGLSPSAISVSEATDVVFRVRLKDPDKKPTEITVEETDESGSPFRVLGHLVNDGTSGDLLAGDYVYSGTFNVVSDTEGAAVFRAKAIFPDVPEAVYTDIRRLVVTRFPIGIAPSDTSKIVTDPDTGHRLLSNEVSVLFAEGTDPDTIEAIAGAVGGTVVGMSYGGFCQIRFPGTGDAAGVYNAMDILRGFPEVEITEPYFMDGGICSYPPSDMSCRAGDQWALDRIRAEEAWVIARGENVTVGVLDSGIDSGHPDLKDNTVEIPDTHDEHGHGTGMAGIIAAVANNVTDLKYKDPDTGLMKDANMVGVAWNSKLYPLKLYGTDYRGMGSLVPAMIHKAIDEKIAVINISFYVRDTEELKSAVERAALNDVLIGAAAPIFGSPYPALYKNFFPNVLAVTETDRNERGYINSNANIIVPGVDILTTMPLSDVVMTEDPEGPEGKFDHEYGTNYSEYKAYSPSAATALTSGAAAVLKSAYPGMKAAQVRNRLIYSGRLLEPFPGSSCICTLRRLNLFDAIFNGNFEVGLSGWTKEGTGTAGVFSFLGAERRLVNQVARLTVKGSECSLTRHFPIQPGVKSLDISFDYNFISPEGSFFPAEGFNDAVSFEIQFYDKYGNSLEKKSLLTIKADSDLLRYNLTDGFFSFLGTDGQDDTKMTGWKHHVSENLSVPAAVLEKGSFGISIRNGKDNFQNCSILADNIGFKTSSRTYHSADYVPDFRISLAELLRVIQFYNEGHYHCRLFTEDSPATTDTDGYAPGTGDREGCTPHDSDYAPQDWRIGLNELLRLVQFYTLGGYRDGAGTEDGFTGVAVSEAPSDISISPSFDTSLNDDGIPAGESVEIAFTVGFSKNDGKTYTVSVTQNIHDADGNTYAAGSGSAPLSVTPNFVETWTADRPMMWILTETVEGGKPGVYGIKTTVEIVGTGETAEAATVVNVIPLLGLEVPDP